MSPIHCVISFCEVQVDLEKGGPRQKGWSPHIVISLQEVSPQ